MSQRQTIDRAFARSTAIGTIALALGASLCGCLSKSPRPLPVPPPAETQIPDPELQALDSRIIGYWKIADGSVQKGRVCQFTPDGRILMFDVKRIRIKEGQEQGWWSPTPDVSHAEGEVLTISFSGFEPDSTVVFTRDGQLKPIPPARGPTLQLIPAKP